SSAFGSCASLVSVKAANVRTIQAGAFFGCAKLEKAEFSDSLRAIGDAAFGNCTKLSNIEIPKTVSYVGIDALTGTKWEKAHTSEFIVVGDGVLYKYTGSANVIAIPENVKRISANRFAEIENIDTVIIPENVRYIAKYAFSKLTQSTDSSTLQASASFTLRNLKIKGKAGSYAERFADHEYYTFEKY
ncbi:MAG: leucine-rich repeat domain-containing protein, partial [Clostridiales bacterium]|nr:leucine-rich repeat domain-containing protein [Clostridiales bacterium]